jgi:cell wall-associated protease
MKIKLILLLIFIGSFSCVTTKTAYTYSNLVPKKVELSDKEKQNWQHKDVIEDSIPGVSLDKAYREILPFKKGDTVIVAVLDTGLDINHKEFENILWKNEKEISNNGIDDDKNGYIDDLYGWNFLGNNKGDNVSITNYECVRFIRLYDSVFKNKSKEDFYGKDTLLFKQYKSALIQYNKKLERAEKAFKDYTTVLEKYEESVIALKPYFPNENFTIEKLDAISTEDDSLKYHIKEMKTCVKYNMTRDWFLYKKKWATIRYEKHLGVSGYNESDIIGDDPNDITNTDYGNNKVEGDEDTRYHSTQVTGVLAGNRNNNLGVRGITNLVKIMPIRLAAMGSERDKDIALAIRYAVDNGAKIINMSFRNDYSIHREWVDDAIKYAESKDVLLVIAAGNEESNSDIIFNYPNDQIENNEDFVDNFIVVGASQYKIENLVSDFSNYGNSNVDIFAPGENIYTSTTNNKYLFIDGTSVATPIVSGVAALIRSYYPNLSASEVKQVIMESGVSYDIMVNLPVPYGQETRKVPFSSLSKSGKVVNAYNALLMAEEVSKKKK